MSSPNEPRVPSDGWADDLRSVDPVYLDGKDVYPPELLAQAAVGGWADDLRTVDAIHVEPLNGKDVYPPELLAWAQAEDDKPPPLGDAPRPPEPTG